MPKEKAQHLFTFALYLCDGSLRFPQFSCFSFLTFSIVVVNANQWTRVTLRLSVHQKQSSLVTSSVLGKYLLYFPSQETSPTLFQPGGSDKNFSQEGRFCLTKNRGGEKKTWSSVHGGRGKKISKAIEKQQILNKRLKHLPILLS